MRNKSVDVHQFAMTPRADIPRSAFNIQTAHKSTFDAGYLIPFYCDEILPGDSFNVNATLLARLATPLFPTMDNLHVETFFFFVPNRLVWENWEKFMGQQNAPGDSTSYVIPQVTSPVGGWTPNQLADYFGLPTVGQVGATNTVTHSALPLRAYNLIFNEWFRDENLRQPAVVNTGDGPDSYSDYSVRYRGKRHDYFTSCLPWPQKGPAVSLPLGTSAPVYGNGRTLGLTDGTNLVGLSHGASNSVVTGTSQYNKTLPSSGATAAFSPNDYGLGVVPASAGVASGLYADLSAATAATINQLRQSFQIQKLLERDARGGTRYTEIIRSHFGVISPDARLQRPEYLGGGSTTVQVTPIAQSSGTGVTGSTTPLGQLGGIGTFHASGHGFRQSFTEHGYVIGLINIRADMSYQQGLRKMWSRSTRFDFYFPAFAMLGEQAVLNKEIYCDGSSTDDGVFGYQERWAEYRYHPSLITGYMKSTTAGTLDSWHYAQKFASCPTLNATFINENPPISRTLAVGDAANGKQFIFDSFINIRAARPLPMYSVPGLIDHF